MRRAGPIALLFICCIFVLDAVYANSNSVRTIDVGDGALSDVGQYGSLELDVSGNPVVSHQDAFLSSLRLVHCNDPDCAGSDESIVTVDQAGVVGQYTSLELDAIGNPVVSYHDGSAGKLRVLHCNNPSCAGGDESTTVPDSAPGVGSFTSLQLDASGFPVVAYHDVTNENLKLLHCNDVNCVGNDESITSPDTAGFQGYYVSLVLDASGYPVVSYYDASSEDLKVLHCNDANCAGGDDSITSPDTAGNVGRFTSIALDASGNPVVSYEDLSNNDVKVLHCNDANCAGANDSIQTPDTLGDLGLFTSIALDASGYPVVSYHDNTNGNLKVLSCDDSDCAGIEAPLSLDGPGDVGEHTSLALDASGSPVVAYYDRTNEALKLLHCDVPSCFDAPDDDNDLCSDAQELGDDPILGGLRDPKNFWDFFDPDRDASVSSLDVFGVIGRFNSSGDSGIDPLTPPPPVPAYHPRFDRGSQVGPNVWDLGPANGSVSALDVFAVIGQFNHSCA